MSFEALPPLTQFELLFFGFFLFILALLWPPLILCVACILSTIIPYIYRPNDDAVSRRQMIWEYQKSPNIPSGWEKFPSRDIIFEESYWVNSRGMCLWTCTMTPREGSVRGVVCFCHAYGSCASPLILMEFARFAKLGFAVVMIEYEGHGRSDGLNCHIPSMSVVIEDVETFYEEITEKKYTGKKRFLIGESMGGAISYALYNRNPKLWSGVVFIAPMCKIKDEHIPSEMFVDFIKKLIGKTSYGKFFGTLPFTPTKSGVSTLSFKVPEKRAIATMVPSHDDRNPRLGTAIQLLNLTIEISKSLSDFDAPFLVIHGKDDKITCPNLSQMLYDEARSSDKSIRLYDGMWHALLLGEPDENIDMVFSDVIQWIAKRV